MSARSRRWHSVAAAAVLFGATTAGTSSPATVEAFAWLSPPPVDGDGVDCPRLLGTATRIAVVTSPAEPGRAVLITDDGRWVALQRTDEARVPPSDAGGALTLVAVPGQSAALHGAWPLADCRVHGWLLPDARDGSAVADELAQLLIAMAFDTETAQLAGAKPGGLRARAERRVAAHEELRAHLGGAAALTLHLEWQATQAQIDAGKVVSEIGTGERRLSSLQAQLGEHSHATVQALIEVATALYALERQREVFALLDPRLAAVRAAIGAGHRQTLELERLRVRALIAVRGGSAGVAAAENLVLEAERALPADDAMRFSCRFVLAQALLIAGRYAEALAILEPLARRLGDEQSLRVARLLDRQAAGYTAIGRLSEGLLAQQRSYLMTSALVGTDHPDTLAAINNYGNNLRQLGDHDSALPFARQAYEGYNRLYGPGHAASVVSARALSLVLGELGRPTESLQIIEPQIQAAVVRLGPDHRQTINTKLHQAELLDLVGRYAESIAVSESVLAPATRLFGESGELTIVAHTILAGALAGAGDRVRAQEHLAVAVERIGRVKDQRRALSLLGTAAAAAERFDDGATLEALLRQFVDLVDQSDPSGLSEDAASQLLSERAAPYMRYVALLAERGEIEAAFDLSERFKGRVLLASLREITSDTSPALPEKVRVELTELRRQMRAAEVQAASAAGDAARVEAGARREAAAQAYLARRASARREYPRFAAITEAPVLGSGDVARVLAVEACLLSFVVGETRAGVFVVGRSTRMQYIALPSPKELDATVQALRNAWSEPAGRALDGEAGAALSKALAAAIAACPRNTKKLVISPDGALALLPFELIGAGGTTIGARYATSYVQSFSIYGLMRQRPPVARNKRPLLAIGAPTFGPTAAAPVATLASSEALRTATLRGAVAQIGRDETATRRAFDALGVTWSPLPGAEREARAVSQLFNPHVLLLGDEASEERLADLNRRGELRKYRFLLFSTHGYMSLAYPMLSAIVLRQPGSAGYDGYLTAAELPLYDLDTELIVLSACETGVGQVRSGTGVMGLPLSLMIAGNRNAVVTLWRVPDASASKFVARLFEHLKANTPPAEALAQTKREMASDRRYSHPVHWAGFVLYGS
jgi:CHAT domain-containing protein